MKSALFKLASRADDPTIGNLIAEADIIFARDENGIPTEGCGWSETCRLDDDHIEIWVQTIGPVMDYICQDPRLELTKQLNGWPVPEPEEETI